MNNNNIIEKIYRIIIFVQNKEFFIDKNELTENDIQNYINNYNKENI